MKEETIWIEFEIWCNETAIAGYMALDEADDEKPLKFYDRSGFECYENINATKPILQPSNDVERAVVADWERILEFIATEDVVQHLVDFAEVPRHLDFERNLIGEDVTVELWINCSKLDNIEPKVTEKSTTIRVKQSTKDMLDKMGNKGMTYDDIIKGLIKETKK